MILEQILQRVKESDINEFKAKILPAEEAKEQELKDKGLKNMSTIIDERANQGNLDYEKMAGPEVPELQVENKEEPETDSKGQLTDAALKKFIEAIK
jgi:hypothetical protein